LNPLKNRLIHASVKLLALQNRRHRAPGSGRGVAMLVLPYNQVDGHASYADERLDNSVLVYLTCNSTESRSMKLEN
jgi:hypothetical protein